MTYNKHFKSQTPQSERTPGREDEVLNSAGGYVFSAGIWARLDRFLILGAEGATYYASQKDHVVGNAKNVLACLKEDGQRTVARIVEISDAGRAIRNDPALFALALAASPQFADEATRQAALAALPRVARIGTHLFLFLSYVTQYRGWGRALRRAVARWYTERDVSSLAYQIVKYRQRHGWTHLDVVQQAHPDMSAPGHREIRRWLSEPDVPLLSEKGLGLDMIHGFNAARASDSALQVQRIIRKYNLPREAVPSEMLKEPKVWAALAERMPMTATIRNLGNLGKYGVLAPNERENIDLFVERLTNAEQLRKARIHPMSVLVAQRVYGQGRGFRGSNEWPVLPEIMDALEEAFYMSFDNVEPTGQRIMLAFDVSGSMDTPISGSPLVECYEASAAMGLVTRRVEDTVHTIAFSDGTMSGDRGLYGWGSSRDIVTPFPLRKTDTLDAVYRRMRDMRFGGTDCALPMIYALEQGIDVDLFVTYTDSETWAGRVKPTDALENYRQRTGIDAKMAVVGMVANEFTIADPTKPYTMDFVGFDTSTPAALSVFALEGVDAPE